MCCFRHFFNCWILNPELLIAITCRRQVVQAASGVWGRVDWLPIRWSMMQMDTKQNWAHLLALGIPLRGASKAIALVLFLKKNTYNPSLTLFILCYGKMVQEWNCEMLKWTKFKTCEWITRMNKMWLGCSKFVMFITLFGKKFSQDIFSSFLQHFASSGGTHFY